MDQALSRAEALVQALPYIHKFRGSTLVVKFGGNAMHDAAACDNFARDMVMLKAIGINPIVVHGGGPQISEFLNRLEIPSRFHKGLRITDAATMDVVEMVLGGKINKILVQAINNQGGSALGLTGRDGQLLQARKYQLEDGVDLGQVGEIVRVNSELLHGLIDGGNIPVLAPIATDAAGNAYNVNADQVASAVAAELRCAKLIFLTNAAGVFDAQGEVLTYIHSDVIDELVASGIIHSGMLPKLSSAAAAIAGGVKQVHIIDGRVQHAVLLELFSDDGIGSLISA